MFTVSGERKRERQTTRVRVCKGIEKVCMPVRDRTYRYKELSTTSRKNCAYAQKLLDRTLSLNVIG